MAEGCMKKWFKESKHVLSMLLVQIFATGMQLLSRVILSEGTFVYALITYRHIVAALCVAPFAFYFERDKVKKFGWSVFFWLFINAGVGIIMAMGFYYYGIRDTSSTYSTNFLNLIPICTFFVSVILRLEKVGLKTWLGKIKIVGAIFCVGGALCTSLYKGKAFYIDHHHILQSATIMSKTHGSNWDRGTAFLVGSCLSYTAWYLIQVKLFKIFPFKYWVTLLTCMLASVQAAAVGVCIDRRKVAWKLGWDLQLITIVYSGVLATAATFCLISWTISVRGPSYPPMFNPLTLIFVAILAAILLGEPLRLGTLLGMVFIVIGLYSFLLAKMKEIRSMHQQKETNGEISMNESTAGAQVSAAVMPSCSPIESEGQDAHEDIEKV